MGFDYTALAKSLGKQLQLVGNLPYNISTPLMFHLFEQQRVIDRMHFMLQQEVVDRLAAAPGDKAYGRLGIMAQYRCAVVPAFPVPPECFDPPPRVNSAVVSLLPRRPASESGTDHTGGICCTIATARRTRRVVARLGSTDHSHQPDGCPRIQ